MFFLLQRAGTDGRNKKEARTPGVSHFFHVLTIRSSRPEVFLGKGVRKMCTKLTGEYPSRTVISIKLLCNFIKITLSHGCFFCKFAAYFQNNSAQEHLCVAVFGQCEPSKWKKHFRHEPLRYSKRPQSFFLQTLIQILCSFLPNLQCRRKDLNALLQK